MIKSTVNQFANSLGLNKDEYIPKGKASFSLFKIEILSGLTVAIALVPEAIAFAFVAGVTPLSGLYAAFIVGLVTAIFGGRPGMISGATGALAVVMVSLVSEHGVQYLFATVILMGILQFLAGIFKLGKFMRMVPQPVMLGFVNGLAIVIGLSQLHQFQIYNFDGTFTWMSGEVLTYSLVLVFLTMLIIWYLPRVTKFIPSTLAAILLVTFLVLLLDLPVPRVGDLASVAGGLPNFSIPTVPLNLDTFFIIFPYAIILAAIGLIESLLTLNLVGEITNKKGGTRQASLVGVMFMVVIGTFAWNSLKLLFVVPRSDALVIVLVTLITVLEDLAVAVVAGVIINALVFAWKSASRIRAIERQSRTEKGAKVYEIEGPLFFSSTNSFLEIFKPSEDPNLVIIDFANSKVIDQSALKAIEDIAERYSKLGKQVKLRHLTKDCHSLLRKTGQLIVDSDDDPDYGIAVDYGVKLGIFGK